MAAPESAIDYELELIAGGLGEGTTGSGQRWQDAFERAQGNWQLERARQLLRLVKSYPASDHQRVVVRQLEAGLFLRLGEWPAAERSYRSALALSRETGNRRGEINALTSLANLARRQDRPLDEVVALYQQTLTLAQTQDDAALQAAILNSLGLAQTSQGALEAAEASFAQAHSLVAMQENRPLAAALFHNRGTLAWNRGELAQAEELFQQALAQLKNLGDRHGQAETLNSLGLVAEARGDWAEAQSFYTESLAVMQADGDIYGQVQVLANLGNLVWLLGEYEQALTRQSQALTFAQELGDVKLQGQLHTSLGDTYRSLERYAEAEAAFAQALVCKRQVGDERGLKQTYLNLGALYHWQNRLDEADAAYAQALELARNQGDQRVTAFALINRAKVAAYEERTDDALDFLSQAESSAQSADLRDALSAIAQVRGDLERMRPTPDARQMLIHYIDACAYAADFNEQSLAQLLDYLSAAWLAHAEDGYPDEVLWFCENMQHFWREIGYAEKYPQLIETFARLAEQVAEQPSAERMDAE